MAKSLSGGYTVYDRKQLFLEECKPLLEQITKTCEMYQIPYYATFAVKNGAEGTEYVTDAYLLGTADIRLKDDRLARHLLVQHGFNVETEKRDIVLQMDDPAEEEEDPSESGLVDLTELFS